MTIGLVVPDPADHTPDHLPDHLVPVSDHALCALIDELRLRGTGAELHELGGPHWLVPPAAFAETAFALADRLSHCELVVDLTPAWGALLRRSGRAGNVVALATSGLAPWTDVPAFRVGNGAGGYLLADPTLDLPAEVAGTPVESVPADAGRWERDALAGEAVAYVAGTGPWAGFAAVEALACGTPVVALAGSPAAEVVDHGVTGLVVGSFDDIDPDELAGLSRWACRKTAADRFSAERAALDLLVLAGRPPAPAGPPAPAPAGPGARPERELAAAA